MPKPVLSDSLYNANDVAEAVLNKANLQIANENLGVVDRTSLFTVQSSMTAIGDYQFYSFNGFMFCNFALARSGGPPATHDPILSCSNTNFYPVKSTTFPTVGRDGDTAYYCYIDNTGSFKLDIPHNVGNTNYYVVVNGWYRFTY